MSYRTHEREARDFSKSRHHRCSHLRSRALKLAQFRRTPRSSIIEEVAVKTKIDLRKNDLSDDQITTALDFISRTREAEARESDRPEIRAQQRRV